MPVLLGYFLLSTSESQVLIILALIMAWLGDVFLLGSKKRWFLAGLVAFLGGHIMYSLAFAQSLSEFRIIPALAFLSGYLLIGYLAYRSLWPGLGKLKLPVAMYFLVLITMSWLAVLIWWSNPTAGTICIAAGTWLFCLSDYLLGRRLIQSMARPHFWVMATYLPAQLLIVYGLLLQI